MMLVLGSSVGESCYNFSLLMIHVLGSLVCEWLWCLAENSSLLMTLVLGSPVGEWLLCLAEIPAC